MPSRFSNQKTWRDYIFRLPRVSVLDQTTALFLIGRLANRLKIKGAGIGPYILIPGKNSLTVAVLFFALEHSTDRQLETWANEILESYYKKKPEHRH